LGNIWDSTFKLLKILIKHKKVFLAALKEVVDEKPFLMIDVSAYT
jgi:hypothetical protein